VVALGGAAVGEAFAVQAQIDGVGAALAGVELRPQGAEPVVVGAAAQRARPVAGGEGGRLVEEEQLGEAPRLEQRRAAPVLEAQPARDPAPPGVAAPDAAIGVVQAAAVAVDQPASRVGDELGERSDAVAVGDGAPKRPVALGAGVGRVDVGRRAAGGAVAVGGVRGRLVNGVQPALDDLGPGLVDAADQLVDPLPERVVLAALSALSHLGPCPSPVRRGRCEPPARTGRIADRRSVRRRPPASPDDISIAARRSGANRPTG
jgi:hypothetical protein